MAAICVVKLYLTVLEMLLSISKSILCAVLVNLVMLLDYMLLPIILSNLV